MRPVVAALALLLGACGAPGDPARPTAAATAEPARSPAAAPVAPPSAPAQGARFLEELARADDTLETLQRRHGAAQVATATLPGAEGETLQGWVLFAGEAARRVDIHPDEAGRHPALLLIRDGNTTHMRRDGVAIGLDAVELERLNGRPFRFSGFDWDYGGFVTDWRGGRLGGAGGGVGPGPVRLCAPAGGVPDGYPAGDGEFDSTLPVLRRHPPVVCEVGLRLPPPTA